MGAAKSHDDRVRRALDTIRESGGRVTGSTRQVISILAESPGHLTAEDLIAQVELRTPGVSPSTIYRVIHRLNQLNVVEHIHSGNGPAFYHLHEQAHAHLLCTECGAITDVPDAIFRSVSKAVRSSYDFVVAPRHSAVLGHCVTCAPGPSSTHGHEA